jgi:hypothetical protein
LATTGWPPSSSSAIGFGVASRTARDRVAPPQLAQHDRLRQRDGGLVGEVRDELDVGVLERVVGEPAQAEHAEHLARLEQRDVELVCHARHAAERAQLEAVAAMGGGHRALLDRGAARQPVAGEQDLGQLSGVEAARDGEREVTAAPRVAHVQRAGVAAGRVRHAVEDQMRQRREARLGGDGLAERAGHLDARLLRVELLHGALELAALGLELLGVGAQLAALGLELVVRGLERLGHLVEGTPNGGQLAAGASGEPHPRRAVAAGEPARGGRDAPDRDDDRAPDVDAVERVEHDRQQQAAEAQRDGAALGAARLALAGRRVDAQAGADRRELLAHVVHAAPALAGGHEAAGGGQRAAGRPDLGRDPLGHVRVDVGDERVEDRPLVVLETRANEALLLGHVALRVERRREEGAVAGDHVAAHAGLGADDVALQVTDRLQGAEGPIRAPARAVGGADGADEQREHGDLEQREDHRGEHDLACERAGVGLRGARAHRGRS